jgi:N,N-dimethylformamidase beta subunit-like protein/Big-like domain-containing protein
MSKSRFSQVLFCAATVWLVVGLIGVHPNAQTGGRSAAPASQADPCAAPANRIIAENCKPGNPSVEWDINGVGDQTIAGFPTDISFNVGETARFKVNTDSAKYRVDIYRTGWYGGLGARLVESVRPSVPLPQRQPECAIDWSIRLYDCGTWGVSASWPIPADAVSGVYLARLVREDGDASWRQDNSRVPGEKPVAGAQAYGASGMGRLRNPLKEPRASLVYFVVRDDASRADILMQTSDPSWTTYNTFGVGNAYGGNTVLGDAAGRQLRARKVSLNRPIAQGGTVNQYLNAEYSLTRWLERNGYDTTYSSGVDADRRGNLLKNHKLFISSGHDEYWSAGQRKNVEAARDAGVNLAFMSGNEVFWKIRYEDSIDGSKTPYRTIVIYKETHSNQNELGQTLVTTKIDPLKDVWTGTWRDGVPANPEGPQPENALTGTIFTVNANRQDPLIIPAKYARLRIWRNTDVAKLKEGEQVVTGNGMLGHEWDEDLDNGFRPPGLIRLSETKMNGVPYPMDAGSVYDQGTATHALTLYRAKSGALVFGTGTVQYTWGLDNFHSNPTSRGAVQNPYSNRVEYDQYGPSKVVQQATVNLFADMGIQPRNLQPDLVPATPSTDKTAPLTKITSPTAGGLVSSAMVSIQGTATDTGSGTVASVEVSVDGGKTWHRAEGTERWSYDWRVPEGAGTLTIMSRGIDDTVNVETPQAGVTVRYAHRTSAR